MSDRAALNSMALIINSRGLASRRINLISGSPLFVGFCVLVVVACSGADAELGHNVHSIQVTTCSQAGGVAVVDIAHCAGQAINHDTYADVPAGGVCCAPLGPQGNPCALANFVCLANSSIASQCAAADLVAGLSCGDASLGLSCCKSAVSVDTPCDTAGNVCIAGASADCAALGGVPTADACGGAQTKVCCAASSVAPAFCGGFAGIPCAGDSVCYDDPSDSCAPPDGRDCSGLCANIRLARVCYTDNPCPSAKQVCVQSSGALCNPASTRCVGVCVDTKK